MNTARVDGILAPKWGSMDWPRAAQAAAGTLFHKRFRLSVAGRVLGHHP